MVVGGAGGPGQRSRAKTLFLDIIQRAVMKFMEMHVVRAYGACSHALRGIKIIMFSTMFCAAQVTLFEAKAFHRLGTVC